MAKYSPEEIKRLDDRMAEMDRLRSDPTMKLVRTKSGKFQYVLKEPELKSLSNISTAKSKPAASKLASDAYKPETSSGPLKRPNLSTPTPYRTRGLGVSNEGAREELQALSNRTSPRTNKLPPRKYSAGETKNMADLEPSKKGSLANQYRKESRAKDLEAAGTMMATVAGAPAVSGAFKGATGKELLKGAAGTNPNKLIPYEGVNEALKKIGLNIPTRYKKGGKVGKVMGEFKSGSLKSSSGQKVTNRKQAMAIAMSEAGKSMKTKKYAAGGKTDRRSFSSGDVFSNYDVGADPFLKSRKGGTFTDKEMKDGLTKKEIMRKTTPKDPLKAKKYAAGGNVNNMAGMRQNPIGQMKQAANLVNTVKSEAAKRGMIPAAMGALRGMGGGMGLGRAAGTGGFNTSGLGNAAVNAGKGMFGMKKGGKVGESEKMVKKEVEFFKKKGAPKSMIGHEKKEATGMKKMAKGGMSCMKKGGDVQKFAKGGSIDGCAVRGKTKLKRVKM